MKKLVSLMLVAMLVACSVAALAASAFIVSADIEVVDDQLVISATTVKWHASISLLSVSVVKATGDTYEPVMDIPFPEISAVGSSFSASIPFDGSELAVGADYRIKVALDIDGHSETIQSELLMQ